MKKKLMTLAGLSSILYAIPFFALAVREALKPVTPGIYSIPQFIKSVLDIVFKLGIPLTAFFLIWAGFLFVTAQGDTSKLSSARKTFTWAVIGAAVLLCSWLLATAINVTIWERVGGNAPVAVNSASTQNMPQSTGNNTAPQPTTPKSAPANQNPIITAQSKPAAPTALLAEAIPGQANQVFVSWAPSTLPGVIGYEVYQNGTLIGTTPNEYYTASVSSPKVGYSYSPSPPMPQTE